MIFVFGLSVGFIFDSAIARASEDDAFATAKIGSLAPKPGMDMNQAAANLAEITDTIEKDILRKKKIVVLKTILINLMTFILNRLAYDAATFLAAGATGQQPAYQYKDALTYFTDLGLDIAGAHMDALNDVLEGIDVKFNVCAPDDPLINVGLQLGIRSAYQRPEPKCDFREMMANWQSVVMSFQSYAEIGENPSEYFLKEFKKAYQPGATELSASINLAAQVHGEVAEAKATLFSESLSFGGFQPVADAITGNVETPAALIEAKTKQALIDAKGDELKVNWDAIIDDKETMGQLGLSVASTFLNTFLSELLLNIYGGLFDVDYVEDDPFNVGSASIGGREAAEEKFKELLSVQLTPLDDFSAVNELVACPGSDSRGAFNCTMDADLATALGMAEAGEPMTVEEALEDGVLKGSWPLIPPEDLAANQDPYCYTYAYCYGNLVKMRKFRIIPVGWEMAAGSPYNSTSNPVTLQEVVDSFNDCSNEGKIDANHPWCHLIDPNWVIKVPQTSCRAYAPNELLVSSSASTRLSSCLDLPSCIAEDEDGNCIGGEGYCTREKNIWRFRGDECPDQYASCLSFQNTETKETGDWLLNTVDFDSCTAENAGCRWYRTNRFFDDHGTIDDSDDEYAWLATGDDYVNAERDDDVMTALTGPETYAYDTDGDLVDDYSYSLYAYEDRRYFNNDVLECSEEDAGCSRLVQKNAGVYLNVIANPSFEDDEDEDGIPDGWNGIDAVDYHEDEAGAAYGLDFVASTAGSSDIFREGILLSANRFYTLSFFAAQSGSANVDVELVGVDGASVDLTGTTILGDCVLSGTDTLRTGVSAPGDDYVRYVCTFTAPGFDTYAKVSILNAGGDVYVDAVQLEEGSNENDFQEGYGAATLEYAYLRLPPDYLGCVGAATDPAECDNYTKMCNAQDVGCELYTPADGDPPVPAIISELDQCPDECVGYDTYKQEATLYDEEEFPLYFIPGTAEECSETEVGCDEFTNLDTLELGGEGLEYYSYLRSCAKEDQVGAGDDWATFFTWEGSDQTGYQLVSYDLLESGMGDTLDYMFLESQYLEQNIGRAPCIYPVLTAEATLECDESSYEVDGYNGWQAISRNSDCDEHDDIFENPDCREFYDSEGNVHYREFSMTATITDECHPYRKSESSQSDCDASQGYWTAAGECRYLGYPEESIECSSSANGCRSYTGGAGRNSTTIFEDDVEDASLNEWNGSAFFPTLQATVSNESIAVDGHSINVTGGELDILYLEEDNPEDCIEGAVCELEDPDTGATCDIIGDDDDSVTDYCGPLTGSLLQGKTYIFSFWAKGTDELVVQFVEEGGTGAVHDFQDFSLSPVELSGSWQLYTVGPLDTSDETEFEHFDDTAILRIYNTTGEFYIDNMRLKEAEENLTLIKDSWVTPSTCDQTPEGASDPQYYLGCESYTDTAGDAYSIYRFSHLCDEDVVGCEAYFDTHNNEAVTGKVYNLTCKADFTGGSGMCSTDSSVTCSDDSDCESISGECVASSTTACELNNQTVCTIGVATNSCLFDLDGGLPSPLPDRIELGPEAVVVPNDTDIFLINDGTTACASADVGCREFGKPSYSRDHSEVESFESVYLYDLPDNYENTLCSHEALFCEEWSTSEDGNFYFKDPEDQTCEWKESVTLNYQDYYGWFRTGTNEPCYYEDLDGGNGEFDYGTEIGTAYLLSGDMFGIWRNGDAEYGNWAAECPGTYDRCTEFVDKVDTSGEEYPDGTPYYYIKNGKIDEAELAPSQQCNGEVSQKFGCVLFNDTTVSELNYNASASYVSSANANLLFGEEEHSKQSPINCDTDSGGLIEAATGDSIDLCWSQCRYPVYEGVGVMGSEVEFSGSCVTDDDCPTYNDEWGNEVVGECIVQDGEPAVGEDCDGECPSEKLVNDVNTILKVYRDRECAEWLTCSGGGYSWDEKTASYTYVCDSLMSCNEFSFTGDSSMCSGRAVQEPVPLTLERYSARDVTWFGLEYSGYTIPDLIPIEFLDEININPNQVCYDSGPDGVAQTSDDTMAERSVNGVSWPYACSSDTDCEGYGFSYCDEMDPEYRLGYNAGACDEETGEECYMGQCSVSSDNCSADDDCPAGEECVVGYCEYYSETNICYSDSDCTADEVCKNGLCVNFWPNSLCDTDDDCDPGDVCNDGYCTIACVSDTECSDELLGGGPMLQGYRIDCVPTAGSFEGLCIDGSCMVDQYGNAFDVDEAEVKECRGYPEQDSPFPHDVVQSWTSPYEAAGNIGTIEDLEPNDKMFDADGLSDVVYDAVPYDMTYAYQSVNVCGPYDEDCLCTYNKATYGNGAITKYFEASTTSDDARVFDGVCFSGAYNGANCADVDCTEGGGTCMTLDDYNLYIGWEGYCLERDTQINRWGNSNGPGVCLTWLPVDQLFSSTDIYAKDTQAGFPLENAYYCVEGGYYRDYYTIGAQMNSNGEVEDVYVACAESLRGSNWNDGNASGICDVEYDGCYRMAYCPTGYTAIVAKCNHGDVYSALCENTEQTRFFGAADHDCPYVCVPDDSYRYDTGEPCNDIIEDLDTPEEAGFGSYTTSVFGTPVRLGGADLTNEIEKVKYCVARGIPMSADQNLYEQHWEVNFPLGDDPDMGQSGKHEATDKYSDLTSAEKNVGQDVPWDSDYIDQLLWGTYSGNVDRGFWRLDYTGMAPGGDDNQGAFVEYIGCYAMAQVSSEDPTIGNKAYTQRLMFDSNYNTQDPSPNDYGGPGYLEYNSGISPQYAGRALFEEYYEPVEFDNEVPIRYRFRDDVWESLSEGYGISDSAPLPVLTDDTAPTTFGGFGLYIPDLDSVVDQWNYPAVTQFPQADASDDPSALGLLYELLTLSDEGEAVDGTLGADDFDGFGEVYGYQSGFEFLGQFFAKAIKFFKWDWDESDYGRGTYVFDDNVQSFYQWELDNAGNTYENAFPDYDFAADQGLSDAYNGAPSAPKTYSIGLCYGTQCREDEENELTLNETDHGDLIAGGGSESVTMKFFATTDPNQFPLRQIIVDWGNGDFGGSSASDNFYKARRGLKDDSESESKCDGTEWGRTSQSCEASYFTFMNDYLCTQGIIDDLDVCETAEVDGKTVVLNSPCTDGASCIFQPRVFIKDNWGYCTGLCEDDPAGDLCYDDSGNPDPPAYNECDYLNCPDDTGACQKITGPDRYPNGANPWIYYDGQVYVSPD